MSNNKAIDLLAQGDNQGAVNIFSEVLPALLTLVDDAEANNGALYDCVMRTSHSSLCDETIFNRGMTMILSEPTCPDTSPFPKVLATVYYNAALAFHRHALSTSQTRNLAVAKTLYLGAVDSLECCSLQTHDHAMVLLLAAYSNLSQVQRELYDLNEYASSCNTVSQLMSVVELGILDDDEAKFFVFGTIEHGFDLAAGAA